MPDGAVILTVRLRAKLGMESKLKEAGLALIAPTRAESGCLTYNFHEDTKSLGLFLFYEIWKSQQALEEHLETPYLQEFRKVLDEVLAEPAEMIFWHGQSPTF